MKRVCLIETESHHEVIRNFACSILDYCLITVVTNGFCASALETYAHKNLNVVNYEASSETASSILLAGDYDYKLTITPPSLRFFQKHKSWFQGSDLLVHNMNYWFAPFRNVYFIKHPSLTNFRSLLRFFWYLPELVLRKRIYINSFRSFMAPSKALFDHYKHFSKLENYVRLDYTGSELEKTTKDFFQIVIPGTVNHFRKYKEVLSTIKDLSRGSKLPIEVYLLGLNQTNLNANKYQAEKLKVFTFERALNEAEYLDYLKTSDLGILPLQEEIEHMGILEKKGSSNIAGGVNDLYYVGLVGIINDFYGLENTLLFKKYSDSKRLSELISAEMSSEKKQDLVNNNKEVFEHNYHFINE